jgi:hypothetical protein
MLSQPMCLKVYLLLNLFLEVKRSTILLIDTREEMIYALNEAAEIEHGLMIQYLFAALTRRKKTCGKMLPGHSRNLSENGRLKCLVFQEKKWHI